MTTKRTQTRTRILDAAQTLMMQNGFHGVTVDRIIAAASISKGSFFYHFGSKDELPAALLQRFIEEQGEQIRAVLSSPQLPSTPLERALAVVDGIAPIFAVCSRTEPGCMMAAFSYQLMQYFPQLRTISNEALTGWQRGLAPVFSTLISEQARTGEQDITGEGLATQFMNILQGANVVARIENSTKAIDLGVKHFKLYLTYLALRPTLS